MGGRTGPGKALTRGGGARSMVRPNIRASPANNHRCQRAPRRTTDLDDERVVRGGNDPIRVDGPAGSGTALARPGPRGGEPRAGGALGRGDRAAEQGAQV